MSICLESKGKDMKKYLLGESGFFYKTNLHCHSDKSDGKVSVNQMKEIYKKKGYSIVAFSDHDALHCNYDELTDENFLALTAYEISIRNDNESIPHAFRKIQDLNLISKKPYNMIQVGYHPASVQWLMDQGKMTQEEVDSIQYAGELRDMCYYPANINKIIKSANENDFLVMINHPSWNLLNYNDYGCYEGAWAVEVYNHGCYQSGLIDNEYVYDDLLRSGKRLYCVASDDCHDASIPENIRGHIMLEANKLEYASVIEALENGKFYSTTGPEIYEMYYEDGYMHIKCSPCVDISMTTLGRRGVRLEAPEGQYITNAKFLIAPELYGLVRFRLTDIKGRHAWTNAYDVDKLDEVFEARRVIL